MVVLGVGNILQKDDGVGVYSSSYLKANYTFSQKVEIINGGVEGINLLNIFEENKKILILDSIDIEDSPASIYLIPHQELPSRGLNVGSAHDIGVMQCLDMLELQGKTTPEVYILGIIPHHITFEIDLSETIKSHFDEYIKVALDFLERDGIETTLNSKIVSLEEIILKVRRV